MIDAFKAGRLSERQIQKRLSDLVLLADFSTSLTQMSEVKQIADHLLLTVMGYTTARRAVFLLCESGVFRTVASRGYRSKKLPDALQVSEPEASADYYNIGTPAFDRIRGMDDLQLRTLIPIRQEGGVLGLLGLGERSDGASAENEMDVLVSLAQMSGAALQNVLAVGKIDHVNRELSLKVHQLNTLFELSKDFYSLWEPEAVFHILGNTLIGQLVTARCAVLLFRKDDLLPMFVKGFRIQPSHLQLFKSDSVVAELNAGRRPIEPDSAASIPGIAPVLESLRVEVLVPLIFNDQLRGIVLLGNRASRKRYSRDEFDLISTLSTLALASEESISMQRQMIEKQRMEKELALAREIQMSLLPQTTPEIPGYECCWVFEPCYQVGGDYFDFLPVSDSEVAIAIGDVSGKSTPAAMIMASVQAALRTVVAMRETNPRVAIERINQILCDRQSKKYVTFVYQILNYKTHELSYVNAGHCYPLLVRTDGSVERLETGGMVMGFFRDIVYQSGTQHLEPGDLLLLYTDGVSELMNEHEEEFGVEGITTVLVENRARSAAEVKNALLSAIDQHRKSLEAGDDITFLLLKRT